MRSPTDAAPLTRAERSFAAAHHRLIYAFLDKEHLSESDYYGVAALCFLGAVHRYLSDFRLRRFSFSTVAYRAMRSGVIDFQRAQSCQKRRATLVSLETGGLGGAPIDGVSPSAEAVLLQSLEERLLLHALYARLSSRQWEIVRLRLGGYRIHEIALRKKVSDRQVRKLLRQCRTVFGDICHALA